ncbi:CHASE2 domain-containing protein [Arcobacter sp. F2176]|uniref:CHASE2 domain-containing protein n=1 Tax=Arcobacter sp. F2176 TaxID=2044511 RepID=UPI00100A7356|nr:adenylate/guanylate cyclase domain-containing protein [Arcobacter sp. F2176]RXJ79684.1 adenylate/guanylate cyclase domain-containing protein [Arcobacter sp. F2176]
MKNKIIKKVLLYSSISILLSLFLSFTYIFFPQLPQTFDNSIRDSLFKIRGEIPNSENVFIVDIDEKSIQALGQWPWSRNKIAKILENLTNAGIGLIAFDVVFAEKDRSSPKEILEKYNIKRDDVPDYDKIFAKTVATTPTILGYQFNLEKNNNHTNKKAPSIPAIFIEKNKNPEQNYLIKATGTILNIPMVQDNAYSSGFFNNVPDESGIIRSVPLIISYNDIIYPSLALEVLRVITDTKRVIINYDEDGVENVKLNDITIPTDRHGRIIVNFRGKEGNFKYISALDIYNENFDKKYIEGKIALVGTSAAGLLDLRATPFESVYPGVEVHANVIDNILTGDFIYKASWIDGANLVIIFILSLILILAITFTPFWYNPFITIAFLAATFYTSYYALFTKGLVFNIFFPLITIISAAIISTLLDYLFEIRQEEAIKKKFASKVSKDVMDNLLKNMDNKGFQAMEKEVTVFFSDVRSFTQISEKMGDAKNLIKYLNQYMEPMSNIITKYQGTIDKYIGDAIMAYWNAPGNVENHPDKAVLAALEQIAHLEPLNKEYDKDNKPHIDIGIGLNTGMAIVGEMGSSGRSDYTVIGDAINLGARLESLCKFYNSKLNISNFTKDALKEDYIFRFLDLVTVKGKIEPVEIWQVYGKGQAQGAQKEELEKHHEAIELYKNSQFKEALVIFEELENSQTKTNNNVYKIYIERCNEFIKHPPENFIGVYEHTTKG